MVKLEPEFILKKSRTFQHTGFKLQHILLPSQDLSHSYISTCSSKLTLSFHVFTHICIKSGSIYWGRKSESGILSSAPTTSRWAWYFHDPWSKIIPNYILKLARVELKSNAPFVCCLLWSLNLDYHTCHTCLMLNNSQDGEWGEKKHSCFHLDFLIIEFCQIFQEWKDSKIENWEDLELWNKNTEAGTKWWTRSKVIFVSLSNWIPPTWINPWRQHNYSLDGKSKREFETEEWGIKHTTKKRKKRGVDKHVEFSIYTKLECNCTTIPTKLQYRIALLVF